MLVFNCLQTHHLALLSTFLQHNLYPISVFFIQRYKRSANNVGIFRRCGAAAERPLYCLLKGELRDCQAFLRKLEGLAHFTSAGFYEPGIGFPEGLGRRVYSYSLGTVAVNRVGLGGGGGERRAGGFSGWHSGSMIL